MFGGKKEEARVLTWYPKWLDHNPEPHLFTNGQTTYLTYSCHEGSENIGNHPINVLEEVDETSYPLAIVELKGCTAHKFEHLEERFFKYLPLWDTGLRRHSVQVIDNSKWLNDTREIHEGEYGFNKKQWVNKEHYVMLFHEDALEFLGDGFNVEVVRCTKATLFEEVRKRMGIEVVEN